ncbi:MAG: hypothetical protein HRU08_00635 [Oleispira sp.]|nr:hypothetical protein [Oleispira sp.]
MSTVVTFLILYIIPVIAFAGIIGAYMLAYGKSLDSPVIDFSLILVVLGFIISSYMSVKLISQFLSNEIIYWGVFFSILGWILSAIPVAIYFIIFK